MSVLVGIPTHRRPELLRQCLASIAAQAGELPPVTVFVADNDPRGREGVRVVEEVAADYPFPIASTVVEEPGISAVRNAILAEARRTGADFIAMIDDDETASSDWLAKLLEVQAACGADMVGGPVFFDVQEDAWIQSAFWTDCRPSGPTDLLYATNNVLISVGFLTRVDWPLFDAAFGLTGGGDLEWFTRLKSLGGKAAWSADARIFEIVPPDRRRLGWFLKRNFRVGMNEVWIARLHGRAAEKAAMLFKTGALAALSPIYALGLLSPKRRFNILRKWARCTGRISALAGLEYREYAGRHAAPEQLRGSG